MRRKISKTLAERIMLLALWGKPLCEIDGIALVDFRKKGDSFQKAIERSLTFGTTLPGSTAA